MNQDIFSADKTFSLEVFPPKKDDDFASAFSVLDDMGALSPDFISVTYGAGGSRAGKTIEIASYIENTLHIPAIAHVTCVGSTKESVSQVAEALKQHGISHILALRGDRPKDMTDEQFEAREFEHATDLISFLRRDDFFHFAGACYPEKHFDAFSMETDLRHLKTKQDAGAEYLISQLFFDNDYFYTFMDRAISKGITIPVSAGIMPITSPKQIGTTVTLSGSSIPKQFADLIARYGDNAEDMRKAGIDYAARQIRDLQDNGVKHIHLYSMNKPKVTAEILQAIKDVIA
jgi:methylenetetrahydrofolate reductase (NADPH)